MWKCMVHFVKKEKGGNDSHSELGVVVWGRDMREEWGGWLPACEERKVVRMPCFVMLYHPLPLFWRGQR